MICLFILFWNAFLNTKKRTELICTPNKYYNFCYNLDINFLKLSHVSIHRHSINRAYVTQEYRSLVRTRRREYNWSFILSLTEESGRRGLHPARSCICFIDIIDCMIMIHFPLSSVRKKTKNSIVLPPSRTWLPCLVLYTWSIIMSIVYP